MDKVIKNKNNDNNINNNSNNNYIKIIKQQDSGKEYKNLISEQDNYINSSNINGNISGIDTEKNNTKGINLNIKKYMMNTFNKSKIIARNSSGIL
jgi:hypothetical protein